MEILKNESGLLDEIRKDANSRSETLLKKAGREVERINSETEVIISEMIKKIEASYKKSIDDEKKRIFSTVDIEARKSIERKVGDIIDSVFLLLKERLDGDMYKTVIFSMINDAVSGNGSEKFYLDIGKDVLSHVTVDELKNLKIKNGKIISVEVNNDRNGLFIYNEKKNKGSFISTDNMLETLKETYRNDIYKIIIKR